MAGVLWRENELEAAELFLPGGRKPVLPTAYWT